MTVRQAPPRLPRPASAGSGRGQGGPRRPRTGSRPPGLHQPPRSRAAQQALAARKVTDRRLRLSIVILLLGISVIVVRLVQLQGVDASRYAAMAARQRLHTVTLTAARGTITDRNGNALAITVDARDIYADPHDVVDPAATATVLAPILGKAADELRPKLTGKGRFVYLARAVTPAVGKAVTAKNLAGVGVLSTTKRVYPDGALASNLLGFVGADGVGLEGLEASQNKLLAGVDGRRTFELGANGRPIPSGEQVVKAARPGSGLQLTIDRDIQWEAQQAIAAEVRKTHAMSGTVVVMDPRTGELLGLATAPGFDANNPGKASLAALGDPAVSDVYEPGSVNKVITMSAALEGGLFTPSSPIVVPPQMSIAGHVFHDAEVHGTEHLTLTGVLAKSSNIGTIEVAERLGAPTLFRYLKGYGFGAPTGLGIPGESPGLLPRLADWNITTLPTAAFGQGVSVNALQVASVYATIANNGLRVAPSLIRAVVDPTGHADVVHGKQGHRVVSAATAKTLRDMLEAVTSDQGTAPAARVAGYRVAGKTGTAQRPDGHGGYSGYTSSFVGFAPADKPQLLVEVVLQKPQGAYFGGEVAAPVFHDVMAFALQSLKIPPTGTKPPVARLSFD